MELPRIIVVFGLVCPGRPRALARAVSRISTGYIAEFTAELVIERRPVGRAVDAEAAPARQIALAAGLAFILVVGQCPTPPRLMLAAAGCEQPIYILAKIIFLTREIIGLKQRQQILAGRRMEKLGE